MFHKGINSVQEIFFDWSIRITYLLIIITALGLSNSAPVYLDNFDYYVKIYVCLFLVFRFNPFRNVTHFTHLDKKIAFSAGLFILTTTFLTSFLTKIPDVSKIPFLERIKEKISDVF
jgi:hypothetical protein